MSDQMWILNELASAAHDYDIPLQNLYSTFEELDRRLDMMEKKVKRVFELAGISEKEAEEEKVA